MDDSKKFAKVATMNVDASNHSSSSSGKDATRKQTLQTILANARAALEIAKELAPLIPVPFLSPLFASAQVIVDASSQVQQNKVGCVELASRVASIVKEVRKEIRGKEDMVDESLKMALEQLNNDFEEIRDFMMKEVTRSTWSRILHREEVSARLQELNVKVSDSMQTFLSTSSIRLEIKLEKVSRDVSGIDSKLAIMDVRSRAERKWDGQFRIYRLGELHERHLISSEKRILYTSTDMTDGDVIEEELVSASVKGRVVAVKKFRGPSQVFSGTLNALKRVRHENIAQLEGYSDEESDVRFLVFKGQLRRFGDYIGTKKSIEDRYNLYIRGVMSMLSGHYHLLSQHVHWLGKLEDLMVDECADAILLGAQDDFISQHSATMTGNDLTSATSSSPLVQLMENLPSLVRDWDAMRDMAAYLPSSYYPVYYEAAKDSARQQYEDSVAYLPSGFWLTAEERALLVIRNVLMERVKSDVYWHSTTRRSPRRIGTVGSVVVFDEGLSFDEVAYDYTTIDHIALSDISIDYGGLEEQLSGTLSLHSGEPYKSETRAELEEALAWSLLVNNGPAIAQERGVRLRDLGIQTVGIDTYMMQFGRSSRSPSPAERSVEDTETANNRSITYHFRYDPENGVYKEPWGYFLFGDNTLPEDSSVPMELADDAWANFSRSSTGVEASEECEEIDFEAQFEGIEYRSTLAGIDGVTKQRSYAAFVMLHEDQADMLDWVHSLSFSPTGTRIEYRARSVYE